MNILILGASGMLGSAVFKYFSEYSEHQVYGTLRSRSGLAYFPGVHSDRLLIGVDVLDQDSLVSAFAKTQPEVVINCVGLIKQLADAKDPLTALPLNSMLPHRLAALCAVASARLIHISTDCVFLGDRGNYQESDASDCQDLYGKSKYIGELHDLPHAITLRTSIIGHELNGQTSLVDWFLHQEGTVKGFTKAIFSGLPTVELARVMLEYVLPQPKLQGLYHVSAAPIDKFGLLEKVKAVYEKDIEIVANDSLIIDRSLDSTRFQAASGYIPPTWDQLIHMMHAHRQ
jgi:dTDP-4-dehydrorhamnose reductase